MSKFLHAIRLTYDGKELSRREKGIFLTAMAIGVCCGTVAMVVVRVLFGFL